MKNQIKCSCGTITSLELPKLYVGNIEFNCPKLGCDNVWIINISLKKK